jgi:Lon protease-like protein
MLTSDCHLSAKILASLPIFPLPNVVLLPGIILPLNVFEPRYLELIDHVLDTDRAVGVPLLRPGDATNHRGRPEIEPVFGVGRLQSHLRLQGGRRLIRVEGLARVRVLAEREDHRSFRTVSVEALPEDAPRDGERLEILKAQLERLARVCKRDGCETFDTVLSIPDPRIFTYTVTALLPSAEMMVSAMLNNTRLFRATSYTAFQQRCLATVTTDRRVDLLIDRVSALLDLLRARAPLPTELFH